MAGVVGAGIGFPRFVGDGNTLPGFTPATDVVWIVGFPGLVERVEAESADKSCDDVPLRIELFLSKDALLFLWCPGLLLGPAVGGVGGGRSSSEP